MKNQPKAKVRRIPALAGDGGEGRACVEDQGGSSNKYRFIRNLDRGVIRQFEIKTVSEKSLLLCQFICNFR